MSHVEGLTLQQMDKIYQAHLAGIPMTRIAELIGCAEAQVMASLEFDLQKKAEREAWDAILEREKNNASK